VEYSIEKHARGLVVRAQRLSIENVDAVCKMAESQGYDLSVPGLASALGAFMVFTDEKNIDAWDDEINASAAKQHGDSIDSWFRGTDTGASSKVLASILSGRVYRDSSYPYDPADIGRCFRMLNKFPELEERIGLMQNVHPVWNQYVLHWKELRALWEEESPKKTCPKLYDRMQELQRRGNVR
jgi:hypothetical protein